MTASAESLLKKLHSAAYLTVPGDTSRVERSITAFDAIDPSFSTTASRLLDSGDTMTENMLVLWLDSTHRINTAMHEANDISDLSGLDYNAARYALEDILVHSSVERLNVPATTASVRKGHWFMLVSTASPNNTLLSDSIDDVDRYCQPLAVASHLLRVKKQEWQQRFVNEAPAFIAWAAGQDSMGAVLQASLRVGSTNPETITSFMALQDESPTALHNGLL